MRMEETIVARATPPGQGGIAVVRLSGPEAERILSEIFVPAARQGWPMKSHLLTYGKLTDGETKLDECMAVLMKAPRSYTREDVAELQIHGGSFLAARAVELCIRHGARLAEPGEFTRRAFLNGRIDLSRAEAVMSLISARGAQEHQAAIRDMEGGAASFVRDAADRLYALQAGLAACMDYPEEISDEEGEAALRPGLVELIRLLRENLDEKSARLIHDGLRVAIYGSPNVGKSSLLNALLGEEKAIVTPIPGTTRDLVEGEILLDGIRVLLTDTAGLRKTDDPVEKIGVERSEKSLRGADLGLLVLDGSRPPTLEERELIAKMPPEGMIVINKQDLLEAAEIREALQKADIRRVIRLSTRQPESLQALKEALREKIRVSDRMTLTQPRHLDAVRRAVGHLEDALRTLDTLTPDLAATDLQAAQAALAEITGDQADERLLDEVFSRFCVGK